jgi:hypothetical protein
LNTLKKILLIWIFLAFSGKFAYSQLFESFFFLEKYIVFHCPSPPSIDGSIDETPWEAATWTRPFVDIEGSDKPQTQFETMVKMLWDDKYLYVAAQLNDKHIWANIKEKDGPIFEDNDFEIFIDPDGDAHQYMKIEMNALGNICDLFMDKPYRDGGEPDIDWNIQGLKKAVKIYGKINYTSNKDSCWTLEMAIPWKAMIDFSNSKAIPVDDEQWRVNFQRVQWKTYIKDHNYCKERGPDKKTLPSLNWSWSQQGAQDMHQPEKWGIIQFSSKKAGTGISDFIKNPDDGIIWSLWQVYYLYQTYPLNRAKVEEDFLTLKDKKYASNQDFKMVELGDKRDKYLARAKGNSARGFWYINKEGKIWFANE